MFLKIQHSIIKLNDILIEDLKIQNNIIINNNTKNILKEIIGLSFDNNIYTIKIEKDKIGKTAIIYLIINIIECEKLIHDGIVLPNREMFFKLLSVFHLSENNLNNFKYNNFNNLTDINQDTKIEVFPHHILSLGDYIYDLKYHRIQKDYKSINCSFNGGILYNESEISILQMLKNLNKESCLFILNNNEIDIYKNIADSFNDERKIIVLSNIKSIENEEVTKYNNIFVTAQVIRKYYLSILKEYISKSKNIDYIDSLENMINDNNISFGINDNSKFFNIKWDNVILNGEILLSKKSLDIIKCIKTKRKWIILENKIDLEHLIKPILRIIIPTRKIPDNLHKIKENIIYYKSINEIPFLKVLPSNSKRCELLCLKQFILTSKLYKFDNINFKNNMKIKYNISNIEYILNDYTLDLFKLCDKYNRLNIFYYFLNPLSDNDIGIKIKQEIKLTEDNLKLLFNKEKLEEFKLRLAIHEKMDKVIIHNIKKDLSELYDNIDEGENKIILLNKNIENADKIDELICPISYEKIELTKNSALTVCNHKFNFIFLLESLFNDKRCPLCRYQLDYKQINIGFSLEVDNFINNINEIIKGKDKIIIISKYENLLIFLKKKLEEKSISIISNINIQKIVKFNENIDKKILFISRKLFTYELGNIACNNFIFCESIWDDELDRYFLIREYFYKNNNIKIDILTPKI